MRRPVMLYMMDAMRCDAMLVYDVQMRTKYKKIANDNRGLMARVKFNGAEQTRAQAHIKVRRSMCISDMVLCRVDDVGSM